MLSSSESIKFIGDKIVVFRDNASPKKHQIYDSELKLEKEWTGETNTDQGFWNKNRFVVSWENTDVKVVDVLTLEENNFNSRKI